MILIADSGSTKTDWRLIEGSKNISAYQTIGLSPYFLSAEQIVDTLNKNLLTGFSSTDIADMYFYGTGLANDRNKATMESSLKLLFPSAAINVNHDLLGAARASCGKEEGIAAILGTGSNSCVYDGKNIIENTPSLGFILGDEGSGAYLGKKIIQAYLNKEMPKELSDKFDNAYKLSKNDILDAIYKKQFPNRFLASFSKFAAENINNPFINNLAVESFEDFFDKHISKYLRHRELPINCVGSIAYYFSSILKSVAEKKVCI